MEGSERGKGATILKRKQAGPVGIKAGSGEATENFIPRGRSSRGTADDNRVWGGQQGGVLEAGWWE